MSTPSDTPRTDKAAYTCDCPYVQEDAVSANFARQLERELAESRAYADKLAAGLPVGMLPKDIELLRDSNAQLATRVRELEGDAAMLDWVSGNEDTPWRERVSKVEDEWYTHKWYRHKGISNLRDAIRSAMKQERRK